MSKNSELHKKICAASLYQKNAGEYGETYREHFLEQYKVAIEGLDYTSKWKHIVNNYFLTIHTALLAGISLSVTNTDMSLSILTHDIIPFVGAGIALSWFITIRGYNEVLATKFSILHCIETELPLALYATEWEILNASYKNPHRAARIDPLVPLFFVIFYIAIFLFVK